ncbi:MAG: type II toxin-antitoxin system RatA family toxin [Rhodoferax sp.]|jgi:ribosome-associated toxin RatA of RatAB toxin-antitoxin module|nr:type II toxin-antitoxin system RatA family toxin [Rhodoferax sp.]
MKTVQKSVLLWYSPQEMYALVTDVDKYPQFLPWCDRAAVLSRDESGVTAEVGIAFGGIHQSFTTRNTHNAPSQVGMALVKGPFSQLDGQWSFLPVGDGSQRACKVELSLHYGFDSAVLSRLVGPVFDKIAATLVDAFVKRARQVYGE